MLVFENMNLMKKIRHFDYCYRQEGNKAHPYQSSFTAFLKVKSISALPLLEIVRADYNY